MSVSVTFSGSVSELMELFKSNGFLDLVKKEIEKESKPESKPEPKPEPKTESKSKISRLQMLNAMQEYCVRMNNRYSGMEGYDTRAMCADLLMQCTDSSANHTSKVDEKYFETVFNAAINDTIPETFKTIVKGGE